MRLAACQFAVSGNMEQNFRTICAAIDNAAKQQVRVLAFPECALTGYPPLDIRCEEINLHQAAPTACFDAHGTVVLEAPRNRPALLIWDFQKPVEDFGTAGIRAVRDRLLAGDKL